MAIRRAGVFSTLELTPEQRGTVAQVLKAVPREQRAVAAKACSAIITEDGDKRVSPLEMVALETIRDVLGITREANIAMPASYWASVYQDATLRRELKSSIGTMLDYGGDRTTAQAEAIIATVAKLRTYAGKDPEILSSVQYLRDALEGRYLSVPLTGTRSGASVVIAHAVDPDAMEAALITLVREIFPKLLPDQPLFNVHSHNAAFRDDPKAYLRLSAKTAEESTFVQMSVCVGPPVRTFWIGQSPSA